MKLKDLVTEKRMSGREYQKVFGRVGKDALVGFEIEVLVPQEAPLHKSIGQTDFDSINPRYINSMSMVNDLFNVTPHNREIDRDFGKWLADQEDEYVEDNYRDYLNDDEDNEREAREEARSNFKEPEMSDWIKQEVGGFDELPERYGMEPKFGRDDKGNIYTEEVTDSTDAYQSGLADTMKATTQALGKELGVPVKAEGSYRNGWVVTTDTSIKESPSTGIDEGMTAYGLEIISPPQKLDVAFDQLETVLKFVQDEGFITNFSTGIHINLSLPKLGNIDVVKLVLFMGDKYVLDKFDRAANVFTGSQLRRVIDGIEATGKLPTGIDEIRDAAAAALKVTEKYSSVNLKHLPEYLEFRAAGGDDYHLRLDDIKELIGRWVSTMELATDPAAARNEYLKKLYKLLDKTSTSKTKAAATEMTLADWLKKTNKNVYADLTAAVGSTDRMEKLDALGDVLLLSSRSVESGSVSITYQWRKEMRELMSKLKVSAAEILDHAENPVLKKRVTAALKAFKLI